LEKKGKGGKKELLWIIEEGVSKKKREKSAPISSVIQGRDIIRGEKSYVRGRFRAKKSGTRGLQEKKKVKAPHKQRKGRCTAERNWGEENHHNHKQPPTKPQTDKIATIQNRQLYTTPWVHPPSSYRGARKEQPILQYTRGVGCAVERKSER